MDCVGGGGRGFEFNAPGLYQGRSPNIAAREDRVVLGFRV